MHPPPLEQQRATLVRARFSKFKRPDELRGGVITERDLDIIETIARYRFSPTSQLVRLVQGNKNVTYRRLRRLWASGVINRFALPRLGAPSEFSYYLENPEALRIVADARQREVPAGLVEELHNNRERDYAGAGRRGEYARLAFLEHELMIGRFHYLLEKAARKSPGQVELVSWYQGAELWHNVRVPKTVTNEHLHNTQKLPHRPDALFTLRFLDEFNDPREHHFFYEADRGTMPLADMRIKLAAHRHFIRQRLNQTLYGVHPVRAVLIEAPDQAREEKLMAAAEHPAVSGGKRAGLFWFLNSERLTEGRPPHQISRYLVEPELIIQRIWSLLDGSLHALGDEENFPSAGMVAATTEPAHYRTSSPSGTNRHLQALQALLPRS